MANTNQSNVQKITGTATEAAHTSISNSNSNGSQG